MCGIFGYIGQNGQTDTLVKGLKSLEYRGYDSAGLAFIKNKRIKLHKKSGKVEDLERSINLGEKFEVGIAHTRWATHGKPSETNAHPHISYAKNFCIVHNGIIENYIELKEKYLQNVEFASETDTEIVAHLLEKFYSFSVLETIKNVCNLIKGSFAFAIISKFEPQKLFLAKKSSPLMFGNSKNGYYFSSDINTLSQFCEKFYKLEDEDFVILEDNKFEIFNESVLQNRLPMEFLNSNHEKENVACFMEQEIAESPTAIINTANSLEVQFKQIPKRFFKKINKINLVACGTAFHSCLVGKMYLESHFSCPIICEIASEYIYSKPKIDKKTLCIFVSQSGETADTLLALRLAKRHKAKTLAITNNASSTITFEANYSIIMQAGWEKAVASTKAYVCQLATFYFLASALNNKILFAKNELFKLASVIENFDYSSWANGTARLLPNYEKIIFIGRQLSYFTAMEASLKLKEITYLNSIACASGELKHGTLALVDNKTLVVAILCEKNLNDKNVNSLKEITARDGNLLVLSPFAENFNGKEKNNLLLPNINENFLPIISIIPLQKLACKISQNLGYNPDMPKNLSKSVTVE